MMRISDPTAIALRPTKAMHALTENHNRHRELNSTVSCAFRMHILPYNIRQLDEMYIAM